MRVLAILNKELRDIIKNRLLLFTIALPPLIFAVLPIVFIFAAQSDPMSPSELEMLYRMEPGMRGLDAATATQVLLVGQMFLFYLIIPAAIPLAIASFSIIGEKQSRSLEPLLATPVRVWELLCAKSLAAVLPAVVATWAGYGISLLAILLLGSALTLQVALNPVWLLSMFTLAPLLGVAAVGLAVIISSRVNDTRVAQQASIILILPIIGLFVGQMAGRILVNVPTILLASAASIAADAGLLFVAVRLFRRETILTEWR